MISSFATAASASRFAGEPAVSSSIVPSDDGRSMAGGLDGREVIGTMAVRRIKGTAQGDATTAEDHC